jgi:hypothetical protein
LSIFYHTVIARAKSGDFPDTIVLAGIGILLQRRGQIGSSHVRSKAIPVI